jgi:hypothetical protein
MFLLKLLLLFLAVKLVWVAGLVIVGLFWAGVFFIIAARSLREKLAPRPGDLRFPR